MGCRRIWEEGELVDASKVDCVATSNATKGNGEKGKAFWKDVTNCFHHLSPVNHLLNTLFLTVTSL